MLKTRILLVVVSAAIIWLIFLLPKVVVDNESKLNSSTPSDSVAGAIDSHIKAPKEVISSIHSLRGQYSESTKNEKNAIFADSLANLYGIAGKYDSAAWFAERAAEFFNTVESRVKAGDLYYQAYTFAVDPSKQALLARKTQVLYGKALDEKPALLEVKTKMAMTYLTSSSPMQGIKMLREVIAADPENELALFNMGMLSIQSGQHPKAVEWLEKLVKVNPDHIQGQLLLGIALMNTGEKKAAKEQFEKVKKMEQDPAVQAQVDSYLKDLK